jgi:hypothetical protein
MHGVCRVEGEVFAFGSLPGTDTAEVYNIRDNTWSQIAHMPAFLYGVSSAYYTGKIFISAYNHAQIVVYSVNSGPYSGIDLLFPVNHSK